MDKEDIAVVTAVVLLLSGIVLCFISFFSPPVKGEISDSVLWYLGQSLVYAGSVFGFKNYIDYKAKH